MHAKQQILIFLLTISSISSKIQDDNVVNVVVSDVTTIPQEVPDQTHEVTQRRRVDESPCFHADINDFCFNRTEKAPCECEVYRDAIICCNVSDIVKSISCLSLNLINFKNIHVINATQSEINITHLNSLKSVDSLVITDGNVTRISGQFSRFSAIKCLNFSNNGIREINERALLNLSQLKLLDVSANNLTKLPPLSNITIDIQGNSKIPCINISATLDKVSYCVCLFCQFLYVFLTINELINFHKGDICEQAKIVLRERSDGRLVQ